MEKINGGVCAPEGFMASGIIAGIKAGHTDKKDMAMIFSKEPCKAAGTFTSNLVKAAPVKWDKQIVSSDKTVKAVLVNSGVANACTGQKGIDDCDTLSKKVKSVATIDNDEVLICSTGVIGANLPVEIMECERMLPMQS